MERGGYVYLLTNENKTVLYTGVTSSLRIRITEHKEKSHGKSFSARYHVDRIVYFESFLHIEEAIAREKQIKAGTRKSKEALINKQNPGWNDLFDTLED